MFEEKYYVKLVLIFLHLQADSQKYPQVAWQEIGNVLKQVSDMITLFL